MTTSIGNKKIHTGANFKNQPLIIEKVQQRQSWIKWLALFGAFLFQAIPYGVADNILGNMEPFVVDGGKLSDGHSYFGIFGGHPDFGSGALMGSFVLFTLVFTFGALISAFATPFLGKLFGSKKVNLKFLLAVGCFISGFSFAMIGILGYIWPTNAAYMNNDFAAKAIWLYFWYGLCLIGTSIFSSLGVPFIVGAWIPGKNRGTALGVAFAGGSVGNLIWQVAINQTLAHIVVYNAFFIYGSVSVIGGILIALLLINLPKTFAISNTSQKVFTDNLSKEEEIKKNGAGLKTTLTVPYFYLLCASYGIFGLGIAGAASQWPTFVHQGLYLAAERIIGPGQNPAIYLANVATVVGVVYGVSCLIGNLTGGYLFSKLNASGAFLVGGTIRTIGSVLMLLGVIDPYYTVIGVGLCGFTCYTYTSASGFMATSLFGKKDASVVIGFLSIGFAVGFAISSPILSGIQTSSKVCDIGSYQFSGQWVGVWVFTAIVLAVGTVCFYFCARKIEKLGYWGMANSNFSRYGKKISKYQLQVYFIANKIWRTGKDERLNNAYAASLMSKQKDWNDARLTILNEKEEQEYETQLNNIEQKTNTKLSKAQLQIKNIEAKIEAIKLTAEEETTIKEKIAKVNQKIAFYSQKIDAAYNELINSVQNELQSEENEKIRQDLTNLISKLNNDEEIDEIDYNNKSVITYFVKYATYISKIQTCDASLKVIENPMLHKLNIQLAKAKYRLMTINYSHQFALQRAKKAHEQILTWNANKFFVLNQLIDEKIKQFEDEKQRHIMAKISELNLLINNEKTHADKYANRLKHIVQSWDKSEYHKDITNIHFPIKNDELNNNKDLKSPKQDHLN